MNISYIVHRVMSPLLLYHGSTQIIPSIGSPENAGLEYDRQNSSIKSKSSYVNVTKRTCDRV